MREWHAAGDDSGTVTPQPRPTARIGARHPHAPTPRNQTRANRPRPKEVVPTSGPISSSSEPCTSYHPGADIVPGQAVMGSPSSLPAGEMAPRPTRHVAVPPDAARRAASRRRCPITPQVTAGIEATDRVLVTPNSAAIWATVDAPASWHLARPTARRYSPCAVVASMHRASPRLPRSSLGPNLVRETAASGPSRRSVQPGGFGHAHHRSTSRPCGGSGHPRFQQAPGAADTEGDVPRVRGHSGALTEQADEPKLSDSGGGGQLVEPDVAAETVGEVVTGQSGARGRRAD